ncbi:MAG: hypothetical protein ACREOO_16510 [bacterium]
MIKKPIHRLFFLVTLCAAPGTCLAQQQWEGGLELYGNIVPDEPFSLTPIVNYNSDLLYIEARYNYEEMHSASLYVGKFFSKEGKLSFDFAPLLGIVAGDLNAGSVGASIELRLGKLQWSILPQYTFSWNGKTENFFYSWSELTFAASEWLYLGPAAQRTKLFESPFEVDSGMTLGFNLKQWSMQLYCFNPWNDGRYFLIGMFYRYH